MTPPITRRRVLVGAGALGAGLALTPRSAVATARTPQLAFLNHTYTVLDRETADAVAENAYLRRFGAFQLRTTTNGQQTYTGRYLLGKQTYLEMFGPGDLPAPDDQLGTTGLALSPDRVGGLAQVTTRLRELGVTDPLEITQTKEIDGAQVPWFDVVAPSTTYSALFPWVMEYLESYFADPRTASEPASFPGDVSRERYSPDTYRDRLLRDVVAVEIGVPAADLPAATVLLRASGLRVRQRGEVTVAVGRGETFVLRTTSRADAGWRRIVMILNTPVRRAHVERIGRSTLRVGPGPQAVWTFR